MSSFADELEQLLPPLYAQEGLGEDAIVHVHVFNPCGQGDWWITEGSREGDDFIMFGLCDLGFPELGYVSLNELRSVGFIELGSRSRSGSVDLTGNKGDFAWHPHRKQCRSTYPRRRSVRP